MYLFATFNCSSFEIDVIARAISTLPRTVFHGIRAKDWKMTPILLIGDVTGWPWKRTSPLVGASRPSIIRSIVLLPHPDGPTIARNSLGTWKEMLSRTVMLLPSLK